MKAFKENRVKSLPASDVNNATWPDNKEQIACYQVVAVYKGDFKYPVTLRLFMGRSNQASVVYACIWCNTPDRWFSGKGNAGGYGYCKQSAAADSAIRDAGIVLEKSIAGVGESAIREALAAITRKLGYRKFTIVESKI